MNVLAWLRRLAAPLRILALASSAGLLAIAVVAGLGSNLGAANPADREPMGLVVALVTLAYVGTFWRSTTPGIASRAADFLGGLLQIGGIVLCVLSFRALGRDPHGVASFHCGLPGLAASVTALIGLFSALAIAAMQAHGYVARRSAASLPPAPPGP